MIVKSANPLSPDVVITFNNVEVNYQSITSLTLSLDEDCHDVCTIKMAGIPPRAITDYIDAAVRVVISSGAGRRQEFCGYVMFVEPVSQTRHGTVNQSPFQDASIVCMGASMCMRGDKSKVWEDISIGMLATSMANTYGFSLDVSYDPFTYPRLVQKNESDWAFLTHTANRYGMRVTVHGTHMHVYNISKVVGRSASYMQLVTTRNKLEGVPGAILSFEGTFGYDTPQGSSTSYRVAALDSSGTITTVTSADVGSKSIAGNNTLSKYYSTLSSTAQTVAEAEREIKAKEQMVFPFNATVEVTAGAGAVPGGVVSIDNYNSNFDGLWYVKSVTHTVGGSGYLTTLSIARDFDLSDKFSIPSVERMGTPPAPKFTDGSWKTSVLKVNKYV